MSDPQGSSGGGHKPLQADDPRNVGPYRLLGVLGSGGMGRVYLGQSRSGLLVAVKTVRADMAGTSAFRERFAREAAAARQVSGVYTAAVVDADARAPMPWLATAYVPAPSLHLLVRQAGPLPVPSVLWLAAGIAEALDSIHRVGLIHRDLKPSNVLVTRDNPKVIDFGLVRTDDASVQLTQSVIGTPQYMSPEQARDAAAVSPATDVYSLGATLLYAATGRNPYPGDTPVNVLARLLTEPLDLSGVPAELADLIRRCTRRDPALRPTPHQLLEEIGGAWLESTGGFGALRWLPQSGYDLVDSYERRGRPDSSGGSGGSGGSGAASGSGRPGTRSTPTTRTGPSSQHQRHPEPQRHPQPLRPPEPPRGPASRSERFAGPTSAMQPATLQPTTLSPPITPTPSLPPDQPGSGDHGDRSAAQRSATGDRPASPGGPRRRTLLWAAGGVIAAGAAGAGTWGAFRLLDSDRDGDGTGPRPWAFLTGGEVYSSPALVGGLVYIGSNDSHLYALDALTGKEKWRYPTGGGVTSSPAVANGLVYVGCNDTLVHAVDAASGKARWTFRTGGVMHSSPTVVDGVVYIGCRDNKLYALDATSGKRIWEFSGGDWFNSSPTVAGGGVFVGCRDHNVYRLDAATGKKRWQFTTESTVDSSAAVSGDTLWIGGDDKKVYALSATTGKSIWIFPAGDGVVSTPLLVNRVVYVGSYDGNLYALNATTGRPHWSFKTDNYIRSSPAVAEGLVYVGSGDRSVYAVDVISGEKRWSYATEKPMDDSSPAVANGLVYIGSLDGRVYALDAKTGKGP